MEEIDEQELFAVMDERTQVGYQLAKHRLIATKQQARISQLEKQLDELQRKEAVANNGN